MKKVINYVLMFVMLASLIPVQPAEAATGIANFFIPDDAQLKSTANMDLSTPADLNRSTVKISNSATLSIGGMFQQLNATSLALTVDQITSINGGAWAVQPGKTALTPVTATNNRFQVNSVQLFPGYNRLTFTGMRGAATTTDVFYVLYESAPIINKLQITSNSQNYDLNEGASLVVTSATALIQGSADNAKTVTVNGRSASVLGNGTFYAPTVTLTPGLNEFEITLTNPTDSLTVKRQVYYYDANSPFTKVDLTHGTADPADSFSETYSILGSANPTFTGDAVTATLNLEFLAPAAFNEASAAVTVNGAAPVSHDTPTATVITNTYGAASYKLVSIKNVVYNLQAAGTTLNTNQTAAITVSDGTTPTPISVRSAALPFTIAPNNTIIKKVLLLPDYPGGATAVTATTPTTPLNGSQVKSSEFYVLVETSKPISGPNDIKVALQPAGNPAGFTAVETGASVDSTAWAGNWKVVKISNLPEGAQTIAFSYQTEPVSFTARVSYVSKLYIELDNLYEGQVIDAATLTDPKMIRLAGRFIGFENRLKPGTQLIINNNDKSGLMTITGYEIDTQTANYPTAGITTPGVTIDATNGPFFHGENTVKIIAKYTDQPGTGVLREYIKEIKFYIIDSNTPNILDIRPLTPPAGSATRGELSDSIPSNYLPASPELQLNNGVYTTTLRAFDLYVEGAGAVGITIKKGADLIYSANPANFGAYSAPVANAFTSVSSHGNRGGFKIRLNDVAIPIGTHVFTIELTNANGAKVVQTLTIESQDMPYRILAPVANTGSAILVNRNFVLFDIEAVGATDVQIDGNSAKPRGAGFPNRYTYTLTGLKGDADNKISVVIKRAGGDIEETVTVTYVTNPDAGAMFMEPLGTKHSVFNKAVQLSFPKGNALRRVTDGKIQPQPNILFGIAKPTNGNTDLVNDYNQIVGHDIDFRTPKTPVQTTIPIDSSLSTQFSSPSLGRDHFVRVSDYYWISAGMAELKNVGEAGYKEATGGLAPYSTEGTYTRYDEDRKLLPNERGTLTLKYEDSVVDQAAAEVTVFYLNDKGIWKNLGGKVDPKASTITVPFDDFGYYMVGKLRYGYDDISNHTWARDVLQALLAKGHMPAIYPDSFGAGDNITRGEFAAMLVRSLGLRLNADDNPTFNDIDVNSVSDAWSYAEIETAARAGIVQGLDNLIFAPDVEVTRQDAAVMIGRATNVKLAPNDAKLQASINKAFADGDVINTYARASVDAVNSAGIMVGSPVISPLPTAAKPLLNFNPLANMTRAEAGQVMVRLLQKYQKGSLPANLS
ncbi:S-layer homology domain-containing protein [Paenibacillus xerothermodurans]|nr:S-layer homology domain-containing protein [Paenibacillus xerothermodurans]